MKTINIKKYNNRKLYLTGMGYITLGDIVTLVLAGSQIQVTCATTGKDRTQQVLGQALGRLDIPVTTMQGLIRDHACIDA